MGPDSPGKGVVRVARSTKRPALRAPAGSREAARLLSEAEVYDSLRLDDEALDALRACCSLRPPRNAAAIVSAIKTRLEFSQPKPVQKSEVDVRGTIQVINPYAKPEGA